MKTLIFNGSPRPKGETKKMIDQLRERMGGEIKIVNAYTADIRPCIDCRFCLTHDGCAVKDEMQTVYDDIQEADCIVIASPIYYEELTGMLLAVMSRLQTYFGARYVRHEEPIQKKKKGAILLAAGSIGPREKAESTAKMLLDQLRCEHAGTVYMGRTDKKSLEEQPEVVEQIRELAEILNKHETE